MPSKKQLRPKKYKVNPDDSGLIHLVNEPMVAFMKETTLFTNALLETLLGENAIEQMRTGLRFEEFERMFEGWSISGAMWSELLGINPRTFERIRKERKVFSFQQSGHLLEMYALLKYGTEVFGSREKFWHWLSSPKPAFRDKRPLEYLDSTLGIGYLYAELGRIEHGVFA